MFAGEMLKLASAYAKLQSGCLKVQVGCVIAKDSKILALGANRTIPNLCKTSRGCLRIEKYGENTKDHRNPEDCRAIHSEIDAICNSFDNLTGAVMYITRYPCEDCARAIVAAGIKTVVYGRDQEISPETARIFEYYNVDVLHYREFTEEDVNY